MFKLKRIIPIASVVLLSFVVSGCVSDSYYGSGGYYGPSYGGYYGGGAVVYNSGPKYHSRQYRDNKYYRNHKPRRDENHYRPAPKPNQPDGRPHNRPSKNYATRTGNSGDRIYFQTDKGPVSIVKRGPR